MEPNENEGPFRDDDKTAGAGDVSIADQFIKEFFFFLVGLLIGFFWHIYYTEDRDPKVHMIIGLVVIIICLSRYIMLIKRRGQEDS